MAVVDGAQAMLTVLTLWKPPRAQFAEQGERAFWAWEQEGQRYIERWEAGVARYVPEPFRLMRLSGTDAPGWWDKVHMFRPEIAFGRCLWLDLDNVISGSLEALVNLPLDDDTPMIMADDRAFPGLANGSVMLFDADRLRYLWEEYAESPLAIEAEFSERDRWPYASDQAFVADRIRARGRRIPYFQDLLPPAYLLMASELEAGAAWSETHLVCGQGLPKPHQSTHPFYAAHWRDGVEVAA